MRIISGEFRGRNINMVKSETTRPTMDKVRESIYNIINPYMNRGYFLDLFAGSGSMGFEALSRGFEMAYFNDLSFDAIKVIKSNIELLKVNNKCRVLKMDYRKCLKSLNVKFDLIFLDPPYKMDVIDECIDIILSEDILNDGGIIVCEYDKGNVLKEHSLLELKKQTNYGIMNISVFRRTIWE